MKLKDFNSKLQKEYNNTFNQKNKKFTFEFKIRYAVLAVFIFLFSLLIIDHISVGIHNNKVEKVKEELILNNEYKQINDKTDYTKILSKTTMTKQKSWLNIILDFDIRCAMGNDMAGGNAPTDNGTNSYDTNVQTEGVDEADIAKCDGKYVYNLTNDFLYVYNVNGEYIAKISDSGEELYVKDNIIITISSYQTNIYIFDGERIVQKEKINYGSYEDSRLKENHLYLIAKDYIDTNNILYGDCYSDMFTNPYYLYTIYDVNLNDFTINCVQNLSSYSPIIYMSNNHFYFSSSIRYDGAYITSIMVFDILLNPVGVIKLEGIILNQFSMDEYNGYFRVVTTDDSKNAGYINAISIYDLNDLSRIGYLNEDIGIGRQNIKSVRFDKDICYCVTYANTDPLYEISLVDPYNPIITSKYEAPGYSNYLHNFTIDDTKYVLGLGYTDSLYNTKISVYISDNGSTQIGKDYIIGDDEYRDKLDYYNENHDYMMFTNHKGLFIYNDETYLYLGVNISDEMYTIFKIDVNSNDVVSVYKEFKTNIESRCFLVDGKLLITSYNCLIVEEYSE